VFRRAGARSLLVVRETPLLHGNLMIPIWMNKMFTTALVVLAVGPVATNAQMPGVPVLQNAFANAGFTGALNLASAGGSSSYGAAGAWSPASARFQFSAGAAVQVRSENTGALYGVRVNVPVATFGGGSIGVSAFGGIGGAPGAGDDSTKARSMAPIGVTVGYRRTTGTRGISLYGSPMYQIIGRGGGEWTGAFRGSVGLDIGFTRAIGVSLGVELGGKSAAGSAKPSGTSFGLAVSYALGRK
jgi:hypothetical protein